MIAPQYAVILPQITYDIEDTKLTEQLKLTTTIVAIQYKVLRTYREFVTDTMPMMATANISAKTIRRITTMVVILKVSNMTVLQVVSLTLASPRCCLPWYILRSFEHLQNILPSDSQTPTFPLCSLTSTRFDLRRSDTETSYTVTTAADEVFFEITTYGTTFSPNVSWRHWSKITTQPSGQNCKLTLCNAIC